MLCDVVVCRCRWAHMPVIHSTSHVDHKKELHGFLFLCIHVYCIPVSIIMVLTAWAPLSHLKQLHVLYCYSLSFTRAVQLSYRQFFDHYKVIPAWLLKRLNNETSELNISSEEAQFSHIGVQYFSKEAQFFSCKAKTISKIMECQQGLFIYNMCQQIDTQYGNHRNL